MAKPGSVTSPEQPHNLRGATIGPDPHRGIQQDFWVGHMRIGFGIFLGETLVVMAYLGLTPHGPHRDLLWAVAGVSLILAAAGYLCAPLVASKHWGAPISGLWTMSSALAVGGIAALDGGLNSPVIYLLFLPVAYAALAFTPVVAGGCGFATLASAAFVVATDSDIKFTTEGVIVLFAVLAGVSALSVAASINRVQRERRERLLSDQIVALAATDGLTGCAVHRVFYERVDEEIARSLRQGRPLSLMVIDVDSFKSINDTYGHLVGDHVLAGIGALLHAHTRTFDLVGRLGGDEFAVLMPDTEPSAARALAERIRLEASVTTEVALTLSIGVSGLDTTTPTSEQMVDDADFALYQVKGAGRDGVAVRFSESRTAEVQGSSHKASTP